MTDEAQLITLAQQGDTRAFGQLVQRHQDRLYTTVTHFVGCSAEAEDIVQEAFVLAYAKIGSFRRDSAFFTWLYRIAFNRAISRQRKVKPVASLEERRSRGATEPLDACETPTESAIRQERVDQVRAALARLCDEHRAVLVLRELQGHAYETVAEILGVPVGTVRSRLHRARAEMRRQLDLVMFGDQVGPGFQAQPGVVEVANGEDFERLRAAGRRAARVNAQATVIESGIDFDGAVSIAGEQNAAAAVVGEPAEHHAVARLGIDDG